MPALRLHKTPLPLTLAPGELELPLSEPAPATPLAGLYSELNQALNPSGLRPQARPGVEAKALRNRAGELYYMLKSPSGQYLKLSEPDYFLWQRLDGNHTLLELALAYQQTYRSFAFERILNLIGRLKQQEFLTEPAINLYAQLDQQLSRTRLQRFAGLVQRGLLHLEFPVSNLDAPLNWLYRRVGWLGFTPVFGWLSGLVVLVGLAAFGQTATLGHFFLFDQANNLGVNLIWLVLGYALAILLHELAHALTIKHFGGEVPNGGFLIFYGMPAFFVNTSNIWMHERRARLLTSWAGPYMNLLIGGLCSIFLWLNPAAIYSQILFSLAFTCYLGAVFNLNVLLELDGYYLLIDWLELPQLRLRSFAFIRTKIWRKLWQREKFSLEERIFGGYGLLALIYTGFTLVYSYWAMQNQIARWLQEATSHSDLPQRLLFGLGSLFLSLVIVFSLGPLIWQGLVWLRTQLVRLLLQSEVRFILAWWSGLGLVAGLLAGSPALEITATLIVTGGVGVALLASSRWGSQWYNPARWAGLVAGGLALAALEPLRPVFGPLAAAGLLFIAFYLLRYGDLTRLDRPTAGVVAFLLLGSLVVGLPGAVVTAQHWAGWSNVLSADLRPSLALVALALMVGVVRQQWATRFRLAHLQLALTALGVVATELLAAYLPASSGLNGSKLSVGGLALTWLGLGSAALYQLTYYRATRLTARPMPLAELSDLERLWRATAYLLEESLREVELTFGPVTVRQLCQDFNVATAAADWPLHLSENLKLSRFNREQSVTLPQTGQMLGQVLALFWRSLAERCGLSYARRMLQRGYDLLHWQERELAQEYLFDELHPYEGQFAPVETRHQEHSEWLASIPLFSDCSPYELQSLARACSERRCRAGEVIIKQGEAGDCFYLVKNGRVSVWQRNSEGRQIQVNSHERGSYFGELALLNNAPRNATCRADTPTVLLCLARADFDRLARRHFQLVSQLRALQSRLQLLQQIPLFRETPLRQLKELAGQLQAQEVEAGQVVVRQGEPGELFYIVESGLVEIILEKPDGSRQLIDRRGPGEFFGETALLLDTPRTATVQASQDCRLWYLRRSEFLNLVSSNSLFKRDLERVSSRRASSLALRRREV